MLVSQVLELLKWQCKVFNYCYDDGENGTCNIQNELHIRNADLLGKKSTFNVLMKYYPDISDENDLKKFGKYQLYNFFLALDSILNIILKKYLNCWFFKFIIYFIFKYVIDINDFFNNKIILLKKFPL